MLAIAFPFSVDDKESNSSSGGDGKNKLSSAMTSTSNNAAAKSVNSIFSDSTTADKVNSSSKSSVSSSITTLSSTDQTVLNCGKSAEISNEQAKVATPTKTKNCDSLSDVINNVIDTSGIKVEIKDDPDAPKALKSVNNIQPALGGSLLPLHATNAKHPVSTMILIIFMDNDSSWFKNIQHCYSVLTINLV